MGKVIQIVARNQYNVIGDENGEIPWVCKADMLFFHYLSLGKKIVCGRKTFEGLPEQVKKRVDAVFTTNRNYRTDIAILYDLVEFVDFCDFWLPKKDVLVIGGQKVYDLTFNLTEEIYLTSIYDFNHHKEGAKYNHEPLKNDFKRHWVMNDIVDQKTGTRFNTVHWIQK